MNYEKNLKYFKSNDKHFYAGMIILAVGVVLFVFANFLRFRFMPSQTTAAVILAAIGAIIAFLPRMIRSNENEIDEIVARETNGYDEKVLNERDLDGVLSGALRPVLLGEFLLEGDGVIVRRGKDDRRFRSTEYCASAVVFTVNGIFVGRKIFSLVESKSEEMCFQFVYDDVDELRAEDVEYVFANGVKVKMAFIVFYENGAESLRIPVKRGAAAEKLCEDVNHKIKEVKGQLSR